MKHKSIQTVTIIWLVSLVLTTIMTRFSLIWALGSQRLNGSDLPATSQGSVPVPPFDFKFGPAQFALVLPLIAFALASFISILIILGRLFKDIRHATNSARYALDKPANEQDSLLPLDRSGETAGLQAAVQDLSAKARFAIEHQKNEKLALQDYLSDISHQLRTPLASLRLYNDLLSRETPIPEQDQQRFIVAQGKQIERMEWLIADLMTLARLDADTVEMDLVHQPMRATLELAVEPFWARAAKEEKTLIVRCSAKIEIDHDRKWVSEAIANLIKNALEHTKAGGHIHVTCIETPLSVQIDVEDDGEGIDKDDMPHIFDRFYGRRTALHPDSIGIGLSLSRMILDKNNAQIYAGNRSEGGARFNIIFLKSIESVKR